MYRLSRPTVNKYFEVLENLKKNNQLWIPYQVGYEFYENRINVISKYENSYDEILSILKNAMNDIDKEYKNHPFLDFEKMKVQFKNLEELVTNTKNKHPKWFESDEVLEKINSIFEDCIGQAYANDKIKNIYEEGKDRYEKKIPPGFKDIEKPENKRYSDLIIWYQLIDKAKSENKSIIFISSDVKEDWWLRKNNKTIMPLPELKKEIWEKAGVDFHIYTSDIFLERSKAISVDSKTIKEVRLLDKEILNKKELENALESERMRNYNIEGLLVSEHLTSILRRIIDMHIPLRYKDEIIYLYQKIRSERSRIAHNRNETDTISLLKDLHHYAKESLIIVENKIQLSTIDVSLYHEFKETVDRLKYIIMHRQFS